MVLDNLKLSKRPAQVAALETIARGADLLYVDRTGGGKSLAFQLPAALAWRAAVLAGVALPPILFLVVPYISLGEHQRAAFEAFLARMFAAGQLPRRGHVCFVRKRGPRGGRTHPRGALVASAASWRCKLPQSWRLASSSCHMSYSWYFTLTLKLKINSSSQAALARARVELSDLELGSRAQVSSSGRDRVDLRSSSGRAWVELDLRSSSGQARVELRSISG